jgi:hypothetical protein
VRQAAHKEPSKIDYALALAAYKKEQEVMKSMVREVLGKYGKPKMTVEELRRYLDSQLGETSLSQEIIKMRKEGF